LAAFSLLAQVGNAAMQASQFAADRRNFVRAEERARVATRWNPWSSTAWRLRGEAELRLGDTPGATTSFLTGLDRDSRDWRLWYDLARASRGAERRRALATAARLNPYSAGVRELLGVQGEQ
jgi:predicted Zn-dependent protease